MTLRSCPTRSGRQCAPRSWTVPAKTKVLIVFKPTYKPHSVDEPKLARRSSLLRPHCCGRHAVYPARDGPPHCACLTLLPTGFAQPRSSLTALVVSYTTVSPSPARVAPRLGSTPLCCTVPAGRPTLAVHQRRTLWSADFPQPGKTGPRSPGRLEHVFIISESITSDRHRVRRSAWDRRRLSVGRAEITMTLSTGGANG